MRQVAADFNSYNAASVPWEWMRVATRTRLAEQMARAKGAAVYIDLRAAVMQAKLTAAKYGSAIEAKPCGWLPVSVRAATTERTMEAN